MSETPTPMPPVAIVGGGFTGLAAALKLLDAGLPVTIFESDATLGGLASGFDVGGQVLERFYHHWFTNDRHVMELIRAIGRESEVVHRPTRTGMYYAQSMFKMSSPLDLLRFKPLCFTDRIRLGLMVFKARAVKDWMALEGRTAREWLIDIGGERVFKAVWEPLLVGKFGPFADTVSAVWFWKKIALRGSSRSSGGQETLAYYKGGFAALSEALGDEIRRRGGEIRLSTPVTGLVTEDGRVGAVEVEGGAIAVSGVLLTPPLPQIADLMEGSVPPAFVDRLRRIQYLANTCLVLELDRSLSSTYWLNVGDPDFPFVGVIEHTNFEPPSSYAGKHIVYLSKYLPVTDRLYQMSSEELFRFSQPYLKRMFPDFDPSWVTAHHIWRADYAQPIMERHYSKIVPGIETPIDNVAISTMAQVYPEDRGTNYAIREAHKAVEVLIRTLKLNASCGHRGKTNSDENP